jgi:NAD+ kinase
MKNDFKIVDRAPDLIVCYGGDGTILYGERKYPEIPKVTVKRTNICRKCDYTFKRVEEIFSRIRNGKFSVKKEMKLETEHRNKKLIGLNEIQIHNKKPIYAIRFSLLVNRRELENLIGDGAVVATPFGSTGYYKSTGGKQFKKGIGISFNNLHNKKIKSFVVPENSTVKVKVHRGPALIFSDNDEEFIELNDKDSITIKKSESIANFICVL